MGKRTAALYTPPFFYQLTYKAKTAASFKLAFSFVENRSNMPPLATAGIVETAADERMDVAGHRERNYFLTHGYKHEILIIMFFILIVVGCYELVSSLGIETRL